MTRWIALFALGICLSSLVGCANYRAAVKPPNGAIYTRIRAPLQVSLHDTPVDGAKGSASTEYFRDPIFTGLDFAWAGASVEEAAEKAAIENVEYADYEYFNILGVYKKFTVTVHGR